MGIDFIAAKAKRFKHRTDAVYEEQLASGDLLTRLPDATIPEYRCRCVGKLPELRTRVVVYKGKDDIKVFNHNDKVVGIVISPDSNELCEIMKGANLPILAAEITNVQPLSDVFIVQIIWPKD